ncbi:hypothetical protein [Cutibacterium acnes]|uniref:hypothetical protein n=1 Tax=Cutibacterium acnes TaxID=1747 RepID=UPI000E23561F|nr:hypothetical protein [Cutibacterium acnes]MCM8874589.1 hypothetical protein [Cutibacterium acnes]REB85568.1 hypothetical protein CP884_01375 [Cutibacterium acnes]RFT47932.1 hypothetical protein CHT92_02540 [Cutibacterium acnes]TLG47125.1 hypothetical protein FD540_02555 [Cutibacterium acnes]TMT77371.1 hypothetical protein DMX87_02545 [Cutibacterium acnes]
MEFSQFDREYSSKLTEIPGMGHIEPVQERLDANNRAGPGADASGVSTEPYGAVRVIFGLMTTHARAAPTTSATALMASGT